MKKTILFVLAFFCMNAHAGELCCPTWFNPSNVYVGAFGGANFIPSIQDGEVKVHIKTGYNLSGSLGYRFAYGLRLEGEYAYRRNSVKNIRFAGESFSIDANYQTSSLMANLIWDIPLADWGCNFGGVTPFIGGGLGYDDQSLHIHHKRASISDHKEGLGKQVMAGLSYPISCRANLLFIYKYHKGSLRKINNNTVGLGITYSFGGEG